MRLLDDVRLRALPKYQMWSLRCNLQYSLGKDRVGPGKPGSRVVFDIVDVDRFVHETQETRIADKVDAFSDLRFRVACHRLN